MDPHPPLLHLYAHVGGRGAHPHRGWPHPQAAPAQLDPEQGARLAHQELHHRLEQWSGHWCSRRCLRTWCVLLGLGEWLYRVAGQLHWDVKLYDRFTTETFCDDSVCWCLMSEYCCSAMCLLASVHGVCRNMCALVCVCVNVCVCVCVVYYIISS